MHTNKDITLFVKAGKDEKILGACPQSQRVLMIAELKVAANVLPQFKTIPVNVSRPPETFRRLGLRLRVPALYLGSEDDPVDVADDIVTLLETRFPGGLLQQEDPEAELATRDFFSRFCFYIRDVSKDASHLESELRRVNHYLNTVARDNNGNSVFLCGHKPSLLDCEVLPKLHQVRVAAAGIKGYEIPPSLTGLWRYLHAAYSEPAFVRTCPSDAQILLHWFEHIGESPANIRKHHQLVLNEKTPQYSFSVPVFAKPVILE
ncbi:chloride intracellular channel protein 4-like [Periplaneta americana]|uniref:chloride intracellular channel protein 4-like n=1 Tax=Periplaneta americana TaxID=6978 RepID=UPI0037E83ED5